MLGFASGMRLRALMLLTFTQIKFSRRDRRHYSHLDLALSVLGLVI